MKLRRAFALFLLGAAGLLASAAPVEFSFRLERAKGNPFGRLVWAQVLTPSGDSVRLPAYLSGRNTWSVRLRATTLGEYRLGTVQETTGDGLVDRDAKTVGATTVVVHTLPDPRGNVVVDPSDPRRFAFADGTPFTPFGANLAWPEGPRASYFENTFAEFQKAGLNWSRVWMCHWGGTNLDWLPDDLGPSPAPGTLDLRVAKFWDSIVAAAEQHGIRFQMVFQHHGQFGTGANANWHINPWNTANGGFLASPVAFFSDPKARALTKLKYRYIVARWGYSPAIMAWELFNEAMWTDARNGTAADNAAIATWHAEMADFIRGLDVHHHLLTTSDDYLDQPLYAKMDFYQPHLYASHLLPAARYIEPAPAALDRPVFYGEAGEDNDPRLADGPRTGGALTLPVLWSSLMGDAAAPAQYWYTSDAINRGLLPRFAHLVRFARATGLDRRADLAPFTAPVETAAQAPLVIEPALNWRRVPAPTVAVPLDGREPAALAAIPRHFVSTASAATSQFPDGVTLQLDYPRAATATVRLIEVGRGGASARVTLDGQVVAERLWSAGSTFPTSDAPTELAFPVSAGAHTLTLENPQGPDWFHLGGIDTGLTCSPLAAVGRRAADRVCLWLWHRTGVYRQDGATPVAGTVVLDDLPAGRWRVVWWDPTNGEPQPATDFDHAGGLHRLPTPPIGRHAAVSLELIR
ncbi:MAG TPA: hypothetical protein PK322_09710 [Opitutaceae bacterium]|nr:hypothetical protein [Opitutaceae bacterium]